MDDWDSLWRELDLWRAAGRTASFWWRDDDAVAVTPALERLLSIARRAATPVALAVIPRDVDGTLKARLVEAPAATVLQHGWAHANHAPDEARAEEYGPHRSIDVRIDELSAGWRRLAPFPRALPVLVAPWNRIDPDLIPHLPKAGLSALSVLGPRPSADAATDVRCCNVHVDIVDWSGTRGFVGDHAALAQIVDHLSQRRTGGADSFEPTGLMTHHLFHDEACWHFIERLLTQTRRHPAVRWLDARAAFW